MDVPRLQWLLVILQRSRKCCVLLDLSLLEVVHVDVNAICAV